MMQPYSVRLLTLNDLPAYKVLRDAALQDFPDAFTSDYKTERLLSADSFATRISAPGERGNQLWGAFDLNDRLLGSIGLDMPQRLQQRHVGTVVGMMVAMQAQGHGIATKLIASCVDFAANNCQFDQLILTVTATNTHVVRLYERAGFVRYGLLPRAICVAGEFHDKLLMRLDFSKAT